MNIEDVLKDHGIGIATGDAEPEHVLEPYKFSSQKGTGFAGTMPNNGSPTLYPSSTDQPITPGYYSGGTRVAGKRFFTASGSLAANGGTATVTCPFNPSIVVITVKDNNLTYPTVGICGSINFKIYDHSTHQRFFDWSTEAGYVTTGALRENVISGATVTVPHGITYENAGTYQLIAIE